MLTIRLSRIGKKKKPTYKIIVLEKEKDPWGKYLEQVGTYNPHTKEINLKTDRIKHWLSYGAQPSNTVSNLLIKENVMEGAKKKVVKISKKRLAKKAEKAKTEKPKKEAKPTEVKKEEKTAEPKTEEKPVEDKTVKEATKNKEESTTKTEPVEVKQEEAKPEEKPKEEVKEVELKSEEK